MAARKRSIKSAKRTARAKPKRVSVAKRTTAKRAKTARRTVARKPVRKTKATKAKRTAVAKRKIGYVSHYFDKIGVAVVEITGRIQKGDRVSVEGATTNFKQKVSSMQHDHTKIEKAARGRSVGLRVNHRVRRKDIVYKIG